MATALRSISSTLQKHGKTIIQERFLPQIERQGACLSTTACCMSDEKKGTNHNYIVNPMFYNRNPRSLEFMGLARKQKGWRFQAPRNDYYYKLVFEKTNWNINTYIVHSSGEIIVSASTKEWAIRKYLYSCIDVTAAKNIGYVLAQRCLNAGLTHVFYDDTYDDTKKSEKLLSFLAAVQEGQLCLEEPDLPDPPFVPGIDYSHYHRIGDNKWTDDIQH